MAQSQYAVTAVGATTLEVKLEGGEDTARRELADISELPWFLRLGLRFNATRQPGLYMIIATASGGLGAFMVFFWATKSYAIAGTMATVQSFWGAVFTLLPDFSKGVFLELLLSNAKQTKKLASNVKKTVIDSLVFMYLVFMPLILHFCFASAFTVIMYFLLRQEIQNMLLG